ncbi:hypothetical protein sortsyn_51 [Escherichia phage sortsyn]|uniref:Uncharacterized protein n=1 Tax=Escherichia phage sortsyn TaxID=2696447 RepID=A0A6B9X764_9CAUD|nr:hypothetical protein sortsyn_51 [Escherichia phage sortsyn]
MVPATDQRDYKMTTKTYIKKQFICLCVADGTRSSFYKRGETYVSDHDLGDLYSVEKHTKDNSDPALVLLETREIEIVYEEPTAERIAELALPLLENGLQTLRASFYMAEQKFLADIASIRQLTYKGPIEGDYVAAADSARDVTPRKDDDVEDAEIV